MGLDVGRLVSPSLVGNEVTGGREGAEVGIEEGELVEGRLEG